MPPIVFFVKHLQIWALFFFVIIIMMVTFLRLLAEYPRDGGVQSDGVRV